MIFFMTWVRIFPDAQEIPRLRTTWTKSHSLLILTWGVGLRLDLYRGRTEGRVLACLPLAYSLWPSGTHCHNTPCATARTSRCHCNILWRRKIGFYTHKNYLRMSSIEEVDTTEVLIDSGKESVSRCSSAGVETSFFIGGWTRITSTLSLEGW